MDYANYRSGWCGTCGRRRGADGRCVNCDPWWSSPLVQVGGPLLAVTSLLLVLVAVTVTPARPDPAAAASTSHPVALGAPVLSAPPRHASPSASGPLAAPPTFTAAPPVVLPQALPLPAPTPNPDVLQMEQLDELRYRVHLASAAMRAKQEWQRSRTAIPFHPTPYSSSAYAAPEL